MSGTTFQTANLYEIAILLSQQKIFTKIDRSNPEKSIFYFDGFSDCQKIITAYYNKENIISPFEFVSAIKQAKEIIFNYGRK